MVNTISFELFKQECEVISPCVCICLIMPLQTICLQVTSHLPTSYNPACSRPILYGLSGSQCGSRGGGFNYGGLQQYGTGGFHNWKLNYGGLQPYGPVGFQGWGLNWARIMRRDISHCHYLQSAIPIICVYMLCICYIYMYVTHNMFCV